MPNLHYNSNLHVYQNLGEIPPSTIIPHSSSIWELRVSFRPDSFSRMQTNRTSNSSSFGHPGASLSGSQVSILTGATQRVTTGRRVCLRTVSTYEHATMGISTEMLGFKFLQMEKCMKQQSD